MIINASNASACPKPICPDSCTNLSGSAAFGTGNYTYSWTSIPPGFTSFAQDPPKVCPATTTTYILTVADGSSTLTDSVTVVVQPLPIVNLGADQSICEGDSIILNVDNPGSTYLWSTGQTNKAITVNTAGTYWVIVDNGVCIGNDTININTEDCAEEHIFFISNSFSPNDDQDNNLLLIRGSGIKNIKLFIYNRWGEKVFQCSMFNVQCSEGWDGTYKGKPLNTAVFAWYAEVEFSDDSKIYRKGNVTLIR